MVPHPPEKKPCCNPELRIQRQISKSCKESKLLKYRYVVGGGAGHCKKKVLFSKIKLNQFRQKNLKYLIFLSGLFKVHAP